MYKVLIVEDEDIIRKGLAYTIDWMSMGYLIIGEASNGEEGVEKIMELHPDVVITDILMPKMNGIDMLREAKKHRKFQSIILTSYAEFDYAKSAIELKAYEYLMKPVSVDELGKIMIHLHQEISKELEKEQVMKQKVEAQQITYMKNNYSFSNPYVKEVIKIMKEQYNTKLNIEMIADKLEVSASYLSRKFKDETGKTYLDFLNQYRVKEAIRLLEEGKYRVYQVSDMTGFSDYKHFCSVFKRYMNYSPTEFVRRN